MLPTGIVTFLFTDIQGSATLWERDPDGMQRSLSLHNQILDKAIQANGGITFKFVGDAYQAAFDVPMEALNAALQAQHGLAVASWYDIGPLKVRMGLHAGPAEVAGTEYAVGHTLNRVARLMSAGHGGQILLSGSVAELLDGNLPHDVRLMDLGEHLLKGLNRPEKIFQVVAPDLPQDFPPLSTYTPPRHNLPAQLTSFVGRCNELDLVRRKFKTSRLVTLTGTGGVGKTRLACQYGLEVLDGYPAGVWWVELAPIIKPDLIPQAIGSVLGLRSEGNQLPLDNLISFLQGKKTLVILDNCEHLVDTCATLTGQLLEACPDLHILTTSREALGIDGEVILRVPPLSIPTPGEPGVDALSLDSLCQYEAVQLFVERAQASLPEFELNAASANAVALICQRLDGIPLAVELAAARVTILSVQQIASRLENVFRLLTGGSRTGVPRHQTLWAAITWSYDLLEPVERLLFQRLAVFVGGFTLEAAEGICTGPYSKALEKQAQHAASLTNVDILDVLLKLVKKSLVVVDRRPDGVTRYRMLETIRQFAREVLFESGEVEAVHRRHREWFVNWVISGIPRQMNAEIPAWMDQLDADIDNLRAALEWSFMEGTGQEYALRMGSALFRYWWIRGSPIEGYEWIGQGLAMKEDRPDLILARARAYYIASWITGNLDEQEKSLEYIQRSVALFRQVGEVWQCGLVLALVNQAQTLAYMKKMEAVDKLCTEAETIGRRLGPAGKWCLAMLWWARGVIAFSRGDLEEAQAISEQSWSLFLETGDRWNAGPLMNLGAIAQVQKQYDLAQRYYDDALAAFSEIQDRGGMAAALNNLTFLAVIQGKTQQAAQYYREQFKIWQAQGNKVRIIDFIKLGCFFSMQELIKMTPSQAAENLCPILSALGLAVSLQPEGFGTVNEETLIKWYLENARGWAEYSAQPFTDVEHQAIRQQLNAVLSAVGQSDFREALLQGKKLTLEQAISKIYDFQV
jgi:predicted ATPase/class 3 adenylate cyclase